MAAALEYTEEALDIAFSSFMAVQVGINIFLAAALKYMWGLVDVLQFIVFTPYWVITVPENAARVILTLKYVALGEFIPYALITDKIKAMFGMEAQSQEEQDMLESAGVRSSNIFENLDSMIVFFLVIVVAIAFLGLFNFCKYRNYKVFKFYMQLKNKIFWNMIIRTSLQSYLKTVMSTWASLKVMQWSSAKYIFTSLAAILVAVILIVIPVVYVYVLRKNFIRLEILSVREKYGSLYSNKRA